MKKMMTAPKPSTSSAPKQHGLGLGLVSGSQELVLSDPDATTTVVADPDLGEAREAFAKAVERAKENAPFLDFENESAASSSLSTILAIFDGARREADASLTRQYAHECAQIDRKAASWSGEAMKLRDELAILEGELSAIAV